MEAGERPQQESRETPVRRAARMCCVYWCRDLGVINVEVDGGQYACCRKHAAFVKAGRIDWFDR